MNLILSWETGSDLDIQVMCGCGKWHGFGTDGQDGGSGGKCICDACQMIRDYDIRQGDDGRKDAIEHVIFTDPSLLFGKEIGMACYNYKQKSEKACNEFKMALINQHGVQLYPTDEDDTSWMFCVNQSRE